MSNGDNQRVKDACSFAVEIAKQFITLAAAGIAFVVGLAMSGKSPVLWVHIAVISALSASVLFGLVFLMSVVGHIHKSGSYDIYAGHLKAVAAIQIVLFLLSVVGLGDLVRREAAVNKADSIASLEVSSNGKIVKYSVPPGAAARVNLEPSGAVQVSVSGAH